MAVAVSAKISASTRGTLLLENIPEPDKAIEVRLSAYQNTRTANVKGFDQEGGLYIGTRFAETLQIHHLAMPMGARKQITFLGEPVKACRPPPAGAHCRRGFIYGTDAGGDEQTQFYWFDMLTGRVRLLTDGVSQNRTCIFEVDGGRRIAFSNNERDKGLYDIFVVEEHGLDAGPSTAWEQPPVKRCVVKGAASGYHFVAGFHGGVLLYRHYKSVIDAVYYYVRVDVKKPTPVRVYPPEGETANVCHGAMWTHQGKVTGFIFASDLGGEFRTLRYYGLKSRSIRELVGTAKVPWGVEDVAVASDGALALAVVCYNEDGASTIYRLVGRDADGGPLGASIKKVEIGLGLGQTGALHLRAAVAPDKAAVTLAFGFLPATAPMNAFTVDFDAGGAQLGTAMQWTDSEVGGLEVSTFTPPELVRITSFDGLEVPCFVYRPPAKSMSASKCAVIIHPHGGPEGQHRPHFVGIYQYLLLELGVAVIDPNVRGSNGYGKTFVSLDDGYKREDSVKDLGAVLDWITTQPDLDASRVGVWGGSYGGYMVLASLIHFGERLRCGVDIVGISNFVTFLENTSAYRRDLRRLKYGDERVPEMRKFLLDISPARNSSKLTQPLFIVQGARDPRVPLSEAEQIRDAVRSNGAEVWYMVASDEGHGFRKKGNKDAYQMAMVQFWQTHLLA